MYLRIASIPVRSSAGCCRGIMKISKTVLSWLFLRAAFPKGRPFPDLAGKRVILVDDGLASISMAVKAKAGETVVAVPTAPQRSVDLVAPEVNMSIVPISGPVPTSR